MVKTKIIDKSIFFKGLKPEYYDSLHAPLDGIWETSYINNANHWKVYYRNRIAGFFCVDENRTLLLFHIRERFLPESTVIFKYLLGLQLFDNAVVSTGDPLLLSLSLENQTRLRAISYLYEDHRTVKASLNGFNQPVLRLASLGEIKRAEMFFQHSLEIKSQFDRIAAQLVANRQLYFLLDDDELIATGELRKSSSQPKYADLGMIVAPAYRNRGLGRYVLAKLKSLCYENALKPICSTEITNYASQKAIKHAGFISRHQLLSVAFRNADMNESDNF